MARLGKYELVREIGEGGMSTVYEAVDTQIGRTVALKVLTIPLYLSQAQRELLVARLLREARAAGRLTHPNIVTLYDVGEDDGHHYIAMERLEGVTLRERLSEGPLRTSEAIRILEGVAAALDAAHAQGVLHRDVKPANVLLLSDGRVKLTDFGVARQIDDATLTQAGTPVGTPAYMAPEQVRGEAATPASDRWALGVLLYEMLAGESPFKGDNIPAVLHQVAYHPAPPLDGASKRVRAVLNRALAKKPAQRYASARDLAAAFREAVTAASFLQIRRTAPATAPDPEPAMLAAVPSAEPTSASVAAARGEADEAGRDAVRERGTRTEGGTIDTNSPRRPVAPSPRPMVSSEAPALPVEPDRDLAGAKGGEVAAAPPRRFPVPAWAWALPLLALLALLPFLGQRPLRSSADRPAPGGSETVRPTAGAKKPQTLPTGMRQAARVEVTEVTERPPAAAETAPEQTEQQQTSPSPPKPTQEMAAARRRFTPSVRRTPARNRSTPVRLARSPAPRATIRSSATPTKRTPARSRRTAKRAPSARRTTVLTAATVKRQRAPEAPRRVARTPPRRRTSSRSAEALNAQGYRLLRQGRYREAEPLLREAVRRRPGYAYAQYNLGWSLVAQGKAREALKPLQTTARQQPRRWEPHRRLAQAYQQLGDTEKARAHSSRVQALR